MKISSFEIEQKASSAYYKSERSEMKIQTFNVNAQPTPNAISDTSTQPGTLNFIQFSLSEENYKLQSAETHELYHLSEEDQAKIRLIEDFVATITGKKFKFQQVVKLEESKSNPELKGQGAGLKLGHHNNPVQSAGGFGMRITTRHEVTEKEQMTFQSQGVVKTEDGRTIAFNLNLHLSRAYTASSETLLEIGAKLQDPLVINFDGKGIAFGDDHLELDITLDGNLERFRNLASGSGFLALDHNNNGNIDDGTELFGPSTGHGFSELATYDLDGNNWIDENDDVFDALKIWTVTPEGEKTLIGLKESGVGAIYLGKVASEFTVKQEATLLGRIRESSIYLKEHGGVGVVHELDLKV